MKAQEHFSAARAAVRVNMGELRDQMRDALTESKAINREAIQAAVLVGKLATRAKLTLKHGEYLPWLKVNFESSVQWISACVRAYDAMQIVMTHDQREALLNKATSVEKLAAMLGPLERGEDPLAVKPDKPTKTVSVREHVRKVNFARDEVSRLSMRVAYLERLLTEHGIEYASR